MVEQIVNLTENLGWYGRRSTFRKVNLFISLTICWSRKNKIRKRDDRDKHENVKTRVTKHGEGEQSDGHDNYGLIYDSVSAKLGILVAIEISSKETSCEAIHPQCQM